jgi:glucosyl-3-phosphoglycerate synthase
MHDWFERRTFRSDDFDVDDLARRKAELGISVSVVLPARDEAPTVEGMVAACRSLVGTLVDEVVVMDGGSKDDTAAIAKRAGAIVHADADVLSEVGPPRGKGDALWRSLRVTSGDIVAFVDADIRNPDPHFVWGLLGPLLHLPEVDFVKAFYDRPIQVGDVQHAGEGGRVTELMARPLLNLFWPELSGLVQPLSGEYAARRRVLETLPFFTGYGVEFGLLVDTLEQRGPEAIAQVDVGERIHTHQPLEALSQMAFGILQVAARRLIGNNRIEEAFLTPPHYRQFNREGEETALEAGTVEIEERPPIATLTR